MDIIYFKYNKKVRATGYLKISEKSDISKLKKLNIDGFEFHQNTNSYVTFSISKKLLRKIKLYKLGSSYNHNLNFLDFMISVSKQDESNKNDSYSWVWCNDWHCDYDYSHEIKSQKDEYKNRIKHHNRKNRNYKI